MTEDNTKRGFSYSAVLHTLIATTAILSVFVKSIFSSPPPEPIVPFEMVEPQQEEKAEEPPPPSDSPEIAPQQDVKPIEKLDLPEPQDTPTEPEPPEPKPEKPAKPEPKLAPAPKPVKKKVEQTPEPPKKMSLQDFLKRNPKKARKNSRPTTRTQAPVKIGKISANTSNLDKFSTNITTKGTQSAGMKNLLSGYVLEIKRRAKANWAIPVAAQGVDYVAKVEFRVSKMGIISALRIVASSGSAEFDNSVMAALRSISLPPPPDDEPHTVTITFTID